MAKMGGPLQPLDLAFLFVGGMHQAMHIAPLALAMARRPEIRVTAYASEKDVEALGQMLHGLDPSAAARVSREPMALPRWCRLAGRLGGKAMELLANRHKLLRHDAIVAAERTSTLLKRLPGRRPVMIHFPHGAGDRAKGFERRIALFDYVLVPGPLNYERMLAEGLASSANCAVVGSIKLAALIGPQARPPVSPFTEDRPILLYIPHFDTRLSSWSMAADLVDRIVADGRFNLIVAPHARLLSRMSAEERRFWRERPTAPNVLIDFDSPKLRDMSYTRLADIYIGDVSSQVYEFLHRPRPCIFINAHGVAWKGNQDYQMWTLGDVCRSPQEVMRALDHAAARHDVYRSLQEIETRGKLGPFDSGVPDRAADTILAMLEGRAPPSGDVAEPTPLAEAVDFVG
jgi:hypothetical protein